MTPGGQLGYDISRADRRDIVSQHFDCGAAVATIAIESVTPAARQERL